MTSPKGTRIVHDIGFYSLGGGNLEAEICADLMEYTWVHDVYHIMSRFGKKEQPNPLLVNMVSLIYYRISRPS